MDKYIELIKNNNYEELANINFIDELVKYKYQDKYLIEYLLEKGIHGSEMDDYLKYHDDFIPFYLKYNIIKPLLNCSLRVLLKRNNNDLYFDLILDKLNDEDKIKLYYNMRITSYNDFHELEREVIDIYLRHGIILPIMFISTKLNKIDEIPLDYELIDEFKELFKDINLKLLNFLENEFKRSLIINPDRTINDLKKIIKFKKENPNFTFINSNVLDGSFDYKTLELKTNSKDSLIFNHELSHFLYQITEDNNILEGYENIRKTIDTENNLKRIKMFLMEIHLRYDKLKEEIEKEYDKKIREFYGSIDNYFKKIKLDMQDNKPEFLLVRNKNTNRDMGHIVTDSNLDDVTVSFMETEKFTYSMFECRKQFSPYLMLENMLDAIFNGKIFDDIELNCISGHGTFYFTKNKTNSFDECLADYDAIKKSLEGVKIIKILKQLIGSQLIDFLDNYIKINREEDSYGNR